MSRDAAASGHPARVALLLPSLAAGGIERVMLHLAGGFVDAGYQVDLLPCRPEGDYANDVPLGVRRVTLRRQSDIGARLALARLDPGGLKALARPSLLALKPSFTQRYLADLARYLAEVRPAAVLSANTPANLLALWARELSQTPTRVVVTEHNQLSVHSRRTHKWRWHHVAPLVARTYPRADAIVTVSDGVADDLAATVGLPRESITTIYNPVVTPALAQRAAEAPPHPWLADGGTPVIVAAGRLKPQKNFPLLLRAFAQLRRQRAARLIILGEGEQRKQLEALATELGIEEDVAMPGFVTNPYAAFAHAALFTLSSDWEGLSNVLIEALACGCPVVSTDCPSGPQEVLQGGQYGILVPTGDAMALSSAMAKTLDEPRSAERLRRRGQEFGVGRSAQSYLEILLRE